MAQLSRKLFWSSKGACCTFVGTWHPSGKLEIQYWDDTYRCILTLRKKIKLETEAIAFFTTLLEEIEQFPSISHWLGNDLKL